jgi:hypothetical protein
MYFTGLFRLIRLLAGDEFEKRGTGIGERCLGDNLTKGFQSWAAMNPSKVAVFLLSLTLSLLLLSGCGEMMPTESNSPAVFQTTTYYSGNR